MNTKLLYNAEVLSERLAQHSKDYKQGKTQNFEQIFKDCEVAANMIKALKRSKHTKKRETQRLRRRNEFLREKVQELEDIIKNCSLMVNIYESKDKI